MLQEVWCQVTTTRQGLIQGYSFMHIYIKVISCSLLITILNYYYLVYFADFVAKMVSSWIDLRPSDGYLFSVLIVPILIFIAIPIMFAFYLHKIKGIGLAPSSKAALVSLILSVLVFIYWVYLLYELGL